MTIEEENQKFIMEQLYKWKARAEKYEQLLKVLLVHIAKNKKTIDFSEDIS